METIYGYVRVSTREQNEGALQGADTEAEYLCGQTVREGF